MRVLMISVLGASLVIGGCTTNAYTGEKQASKTAMGAGIGAAAGAILGAATAKNSKDRKERALKGAGIGAVAGGGVGAYMDYQEKKLRERLQGAGVGIQRNKETGEIKLIMPGNITFPTGQSSIKADFYQTLDAVADVLKEYNKTDVIVNGYTDNVGKDDYNLQLSRDRANAVGQYLSTRGVAAGRINARGFGKASPIASNETEMGRAQNRRVEINIQPPASVE